MTILCAPLVFSRTWDSDFRLLAIPSDFSREKSQWAEKYILSTLQSSRELEQAPRWSLFNDEQHYIVGLSARAFLLSKENIADKSNRGLYLFVGYVARQPLYIPMDVEYFSPLYSYVNKKWEETILDKLDPCRENYSVSFSFQAQAYTNMEINKDKNIALVYPSSFNTGLWFLCSQATHELSLCLNMSSQKDAKNSKFINTSLFGYEGERLHIKKIDETLVDESAPKSHPENQQPKNSLSNTHRKYHKTKDQSYRDELANFVSDLTEGTTNLFSTLNPFKNPQASALKNTKQTVTPKPANTSIETKVENPPFGGKYIDDDD